MPKDYKDAPPARADNRLNHPMLLGMIIGLHELTGATQAAQSESFRTFEFFIVAAAIYYCMAKLIEIGGADRIGAISPAIAEQLGLRCFDLGGDESVDGSARAGLTARAAPS